MDDPFASQIGAILAGSLGIEAYIPKNKREERSILHFVHFGSCFSVTKEQLMNFIVRHCFLDSSEVHCVPPNGGAHEGFDKGREDCLNLALEGQLEQRAAGATAHVNGGALASRRTTIKNAADELKEHGLRNGLLRQIGQAAWETRSGLRFGGFEKQNRDRIEHVVEHIFVNTM